MDATVSEDSGFEGVARLVLPWLGNLSVEQMIRMRSDTRGLVELRELVRRVALHVRGDAQSITQNELANAQRELDEEIVPEIKAEVRKSRRAVIKNVVVVPAVTLIGQVAFGWPAALAAGATALVGAAINLPETLEVKGKRGLALYSTLVAGDKSGR
jgi:23S rRNA maturation mini-RNase III